MRKQTFFHMLALCILGGVIYSTIALISPPAPLPTDEPPMAFSAERAMQDLEVIAREPHPMGEFPAHAQVRDYLLDEIRKLGLEPQVQDTFGIRVFSSGWMIGGSVENILVRLPGTNPDGAILLIAHYDSTPGAPGAADNGAGVVTILEVLRALHAGPPLRRNVICLFTDGHEPGIIGTHAFRDQHPWFESVDLVINIDGVKGGPTGLPITLRENGIFIQALARSAEKPPYLSLPLHLFPASDSDLIPFEETDISGVSFGTATIPSSQEPHTMLDLPDHVDPGTVQQAGNHILGIVRYLGDQPTLPVEIPDQSFFPVLGKLMHYPSNWAKPLALAAGLCFVGTLSYGFHKRRWTWKGVSLGSLAFLVCLALCVGVAVLLWSGIQMLHPEYKYSAVRQHLNNDYFYAVGFFVLAFAITTYITAMVRRKISALDLSAGVLLVWFIFTIAATVLVPATSFLGTWVLLSGSLALLLAFTVQSGGTAWALSGLGFLVSAILATFLWIPVIIIALLSTGFSMLWLVMGVTALWLGAMLPALDWVTSPKRWLLPTVAVFVGFGFLLAGHYLVGRNSPLPHVNSIGYWMDVEENEAHWVAFIGGYRTDARTNARYQVSFPKEMDERQMQILVDPIRKPYTDIFPKAPGFSVLTSDAPLLIMDGPSLEVTDDEWVKDRRVVTIRFTTSMHDRLYIIIQNASILGMTLPNNDRTEAAHRNEWWLRLDGMPVDGVEIRFEFSTSLPIQFMLVEEKTGLPSFSGVPTQPEPGTMRSPGEFLQGDATDFTAIYRSFEIPPYGDE